MEKIGAWMKGIYRDMLKGPDNELLFDSGWVSNTIVDSCRVLLAEFMSSDSSAGIIHLAVGQGLAEWDASGPPAPNPATTTALIAGHIPPIGVADLDMVYLNNADGVVVGPTNRLQITATLAPGYPPALPSLTTYPLREFGLFGSAGGTTYMINCIRHPVIHKDEAASLIRVIRLYF
jgi:hypothetical protein